MCKDKLGLYTFTMFQLKKILFFYWPFTNYWTTHFGGSFGFECRFKNAVF